MTAAAGVWEDKDRGERRAAAQAADTEEPTLLMRQLLKLTSLLVPESQRGLENIHLQSLPS